MPVYESDVCIIGAGISAAMLAQKLSELRQGVSIQVVEAGRSIFDLENLVGNLEWVYGLAPASY